MKPSLRTAVPYLLVATGAILWGGIGLFIEALDAAGFTPLQIVALRVVSATVMLLAYLLLRDPALLRIRLRDTFYFVGTGVLSISFFNWCYFTAIREVSLSVAVILLYTGPVFVVVLSRIFLGEPFTRRKTVALLLTLVGCALVVKLIPIGGPEVSWYGVVVGLGSGFGYALYSIFGKGALARYKTITILFYTFLFASLAMLPLSGLGSPGKLQQLGSGDALLWTAGLGLFPTVIAYLCYTQGLARIEAGKASITAMLEPVTATLLGVLLFGEVLTPAQVAGMALVLGSVLMIQVRVPRNRLFQGRKE